MSWISLLSERVPIGPLANTKQAASDAAVLVVLGSVAGAAADTQKEGILLTKRASSLGNHKGEVSFPGGYRDTLDSDSLRTALREAFEEVALQPGDVEVIGQLSTQKTRQGVGVQPHLATITLPYPLKASPDEVSRILWLPIANLVDGGLVKVTVPYQGRHLQTEGLYCEGEVVWGVTARILKELRQVLLSGPAR